MTPTPKGYRLLKSGETVRKGDKCSFRGNDWVKVVGTGVKATAGDYRYARKKRKG